MTDPVTEYPDSLAALDDLARGWFSEPPPEDEPDKVERDWQDWVSGFFVLVVPMVGYAITANNARASVWQSYRVTVIREVAALTAEGAIAARTAGIDGYGLTPLQVAAVVAARDQLLADGEDPTIPIRDMITRFRKDRAAILAETEVTAAYAGAYLTTWQAAQDVGMVATSARKRWIARISERTCEICGFLHEQSAALEEQFIGPDGTRYHGPGAHPRCRCGLILEESMQKVSLKVPFVGWSNKIVNQFEGENMLKRDYNAEERKRMAASGEALPDGSFPIANEADLLAAMQSIGRAKNPGRAKRHIKRRAKALGMTDKLTPAFQKAASEAEIAKGPISMYETYDICYDPPDLPIPCTPADLTPTMSAAMPVEMQSDFCARWNALAQPLPTGAGLPDDMAYGLALGLTCQQGKWIQQRDGSYVRLTVEGQSPGYEETEDVGMEKAGRMLSAANHTALHEAATMIEKGCGMVRKMMEGSGNKTITGGSIEKLAPFKIEGEFTKIDDEQRVAYGYGIVATVDGKIVEDSQEDVITDYVSMEKSSLRYALSQRAGKLMHQGDAEYLVPYILPMTKEIADGLKMTIKKEGVIIGMHFPETDAGNVGWEMAKAGASFSVGGRGIRTPV